MSRKTGSSKREREMRLFVSYTVRDGMVKKDDLIELNSILEYLDDVYIDMIHNTSRFPQLFVIFKVIRSSHFLIVESPSVYNSPWVKLEIFLAKLFRKKIIKVAHDSLSKFKDKNMLLKEGFLCME